MTATTNVIILNLAPQSQVWAVPHVYQGDYDGNPTSNWPTYVVLSSGQPVLMMIPYQPSTAGVMFWEGYYGGGSISITLIGTYTISSTPTFGDGFEVYLFLKPSTWSISPQFNYSIPYVASPAKIPPSSPAQGDLILPQSSSTYIMAQWDHGGNLAIV